MLKELSNTFSCVPINAYLAHSCVNNHPYNRMCADTRVRKELPARMMHIKGEGVLERVSV